MANEIAHGSAFDLANYRPKLNWTGVAKSAQIARQSSELVTQGRISISPECITINSRTKDIKALNKSVPKRGRKP